MSLSSHTPSNDFISMLFFNTSMLINRENDWGKTFVNCVINHHCLSVSLFASNMQWLPLSSKLKFWKFGSNWTHACCSITTVTTTNIASTIPGPLCFAPHTFGTEPFLSAGEICITYCKRDLNRVDKMFISKLLSFCYPSVHIKNTF